MKFGLFIPPYLGNQEGPIRMAQPLIAVIRPARIEPPIPEREDQDIGDPQRRGGDDPVHHRAEPLIEGMLAMMMVGTSRPPTTTSTNQRGMTASDAGNAADKPLTASKATRAGQL